MASPPGGVNLNRGDGSSCLGRKTVCGAESCLSARADPAAPVRTGSGGGTRCPRCSEVCLRSERLRGGPGRKGSRSPNTFHVVLLSRALRSVGTALRW